MVNDDLRDDHHPIPQNIQVFGIIVCSARHVPSVAGHDGPQLRERMAKTGRVCVRVSASTGTSAGPHSYR